jgi:hypothetical protein
MLPGAAVQTANGALSRVEQTKRFAILPVFWEPGGDQVTPTINSSARPSRPDTPNVIESLYAGACEAAQAAELTPVARPVLKSPGRTARRRQPPILSQPAGMTGTAQNPTLCVRPAARKA